jgi:hypothetical protein
MSRMRKPSRRSRALRYEAQQQFLTVASRVAQEGRLPDSYSSLKKQLAAETTVEAAGSAFPRCRSLAARVPALRLC